MSLRFFSRLDISLSLPTTCVAVRRISNMAEQSWSRHLKTGDAQPPVKKGLLRLYSMRFCPFAQRTHLVLDIKKIPYDTVNANLVDKPEWLFQKSFGAKVPAIEFDDGQVLSESLILGDYLDETYPNPPLYPKDPRAKAWDRLLMERFNQVTRVLFKVLGEEQLSGELKVQFVEELKYFEDELAKRKTTFFGGASPGMLDLAIWPFIERFPVIPDQGSPFNLAASGLPKLAAYEKAMIANERVRVSYFPPEIHAIYLTSRRAGKNTYDFPIPKF